MNASFIILIIPAIENKIFSGGLKLYAPKVVQNAYRQITATHVNIAPSCWCLVKFLIMVNTYVLHSDT